MEFKEVNLRFSVLIYKLNTIMNYLTKLILLISTLLILYSCYNSGKPTEDNSSNAVDNYSKTDDTSKNKSGDSDTTMISKNDPFGSFDEAMNFVHTSQSNIENSSSDMFISNLQKYIELEEFMDGALSEIYFYFAAGYPKADSSNFFNFLSIDDTSIIRQWASLARFEIDMVQFNVKKSEFQLYKDDYIKKLFEKSNDSSLVNMYIKYLFK